MQALEAEFTKKVEEIRLEHLVNCHDKQGLAVWIQNNWDNDELYEYFLSLVRISLFIRDQASLGLLLTAAQENYWDAVLDDLVEE